MKIKDISVHLVNAVWRNFIIVKVTSDDGIIGYGEGTLADFERTIEAAVYDYKPFLIGKEINIPEITQFLFRHFYWRGGPMLMSAISAIEQALWDILGKSANRPVYALLGGKANKRIRAYANRIYLGQRESRRIRISRGKSCEGRLQRLEVRPLWPGRTKDYKGRNENCDIANRGNQKCRR